MVDSDTESEAEIVVVTASHSDEILNANLGLSPMIFSGEIPLHVVRNASSASIAYNQGLDSTLADIVVFAHHDVFLPLGWEALLRQRLAEVELMDPNWAVIGPNGIAPDGQHYGPVWSTSIGQVLGRVPLQPVPVGSFDELMIILRRSTGLRFDEALPNFHLYASDITQTALSRGFGCYSVPMPVIHNDGYHGWLGDDFTECLTYMRHKWSDRLPIRTSVTDITALGLRHLRWQWRAYRSRRVRKDMAMPPDVDPRKYAARCGWEDLTPRT